MNIRKYLYIGIGVFLFIVFLAVCITAEFKLSIITSDVYAFIENFFNRWSPALSAAGMLIVAILALSAIYEGRRSQRFAMLDRQFSKLEEWAGDIMELLSATKQILKVAEYDSNRKKELESEYKALEKEENKLASKMSAQNDEINKRLIDIREKRNKLTEEIISIVQRSRDYLKERLDEIIKISAKETRSEIHVEPIINSIGDTELEEFFRYYSGLVLKVPETFEQWISDDNPKKFQEITTNIEQTMKKLVARVHYLRSEIISK